jgi:hypothetical protein
VPSPAPNAKNILILTVLLGLTAYLGKEVLFSRKNNSKEQAKIEKVTFRLFLCQGNDGQEAKANRLGQMADPATIHALTGKEPHKVLFPEKDGPPSLRESHKALGVPTPPSSLYEPQTPFPPLLSVETSGSGGKITLQGDTFTQPFALIIPKGKKTVLIHPTYNWEGLPEETQETLQITYQPQNGAPVTDNLSILWSAQDEIFLDNNYLPNLAALVDPAALPAIQSRIGTANPSQQEIIQWIRETTANLQSYQIAYQETSGPFSENPSWQKIRTPDRVLREGLGNCLDLSLLWSGMALANGLQTWVIILPNHALVAFAPPNGSQDQAIVLETTWLTGKNLNSAELDRALKMGQSKLEEALRDEHQNTFFIDINHWKKFYPDS